MNKLSRILMMTAVFVAVLAFSAFADGWTQDASGRWQYLKNGTPVYNQWQTDANGDYFYLGGDGYMMVSSFVDGDRYVDATGRMVVNRWYQIDGKWYYFEGTGRMAASKKRLIDNLWYYFGEDGVMVTGWYTDGTDWYYGDAASGGNLVTASWRQLEPAAEAGAESIGDSGQNWFYFQSSGKATRATDTDYKESVIDGKRYAFDQYGRMRTGWIKLADTEPAIAGYKFYHTDNTIGTYGAAHTGWLSAYVPEGIDNSGEVRWYYFDTKGCPEYGTLVYIDGGKTALKANLKKIQKNGVSYSYLFNEKGNPCYGLRRVILDDGSETSVYLGNSSQCCLQKNVVSITEGDGTVAKYHFSASGFGLSGVKNRYLYYKGKLQKADDSLAYITVGDVTYLVNQGGYILYNYNAGKQPHEVEYRSDSAGHRDGGTAGVTPCTEPIYTED